MYNTSYQTLQSSERKVSISAQIIALSLHGSHWYGIGMKTADEMGILKKEVTEWFEGR